jgi:hypothetical protein
VKSVTKKKVKKSKKNSAIPAQEEKEQNKQIPAEGLHSFTHHQPYGL